MVLLEYSVTSGRTTNPREARQLLVNPCSNGIHIPNANLSDPENKYLYHSFVESPDTMSIYDGNVVTDARGHATIQLPDWVETLNREFRYQLTRVDENDDNDFVAAKIVRPVRDNTFTICTSAPSITVSWQVTGIRKAPWAEVNRIPVEVEKPAAEHGLYLHPEAYGLDASQMVNAPKAISAEEMAEDTTVVKLEENEVQE